MIQWWDGFDHYGSSSAMLLNGVYADVSGATLVTANPRTGPRCLRLSVRGAGTGIRRVVDSPRAQVGVGFAFSIPTLPANAQGMSLVHFLSVDYVQILSVTVLSNGALRLSVGEGGASLHTTDPWVFASNYQHMELHVDTVSKVVTLWMNDTEVVSLPVPTMPGAEVASVRIGTFRATNTSTNPETLDIDDLYCYDGEGSDNTFGLGDCKALTQFPNEDVEPQGWLRATGSNAWDLINNVPPQDATQFISSNNEQLPRRSVFGLTDLPAGLVDIKAVGFQTRMYRTDTGASQVSVGIISNGVELFGPSHAITQTPVWYGDRFERDPDTGQPFTMTGVNNLRAMVERTV